MLDPAFWSTKLVCDLLPRRTVLHQSCKTFIFFRCPTRPLMANWLKALKYCHPCADSGNRSSQYFRDEGARFAFLEQTKKLAVFVKRPTLSISSEHVSLKKAETRPCDIATRFRNYSGHSDAVIASDDTDLHNRSHGHSMLTKLAHSRVYPQARVIESSRSKPDGPGSCCGASSLRLTRSDNFNS